MLDFGNDAAYNEHDRIVTIISEIRAKLDELEGAIL